MKKKYNEVSPLVSIVIAVFNGAKTVQQCIDSVTHQSYLPRELIIIDGGSTDGTLDILKLNNSNISYWISESDNGIYHAWNKALEQAKGDWVCFLGADDYFLDDFVLENIVKFLIKIPLDIGVVYGKVMLINQHGEAIYCLGEPWHKTKKSLQYFMSIPHQGVFHKRSLFEQHGYFNESFQITGDYEFLLRELKTKDAFFIPNVIITAMRQGGISSHPQSALLATKELRRAQYIHGQRFPNRVWLMAMVRVYIRLILWQFLGESLTRKLLDWGRFMMGKPAFWGKL